MLYINDWSIKELKKHFCSYKINPWSPSGSWQTSRHIQIFIDGYDDMLEYYELGEDDLLEEDEDFERLEGEVNFEGDWDTKYGALIDRLMNATQNSEELTWSEWTYGYRCQHSKKINSINLHIILMTVLF